RPARGGEVGPAGGRPARGRQVDRRRLPARGRQGEGERGGGGPAVPLGDAHVADRHRRGRVVVVDRRGPVPPARQGGGRRGRPGPGGPGDGGAGRAVDVQVERLVRLVRRVPVHRDADARGRLAGRDGHRAGHVCVVGPLGRRAGVGVVAGGHRRGAGRRERDGEVGVGRPAVALGHAHVVDRQPRHGAVVVDDGAGAGGPGHGRPGRAVDVHVEGFVRLRLGVAVDRDAEGGGRLAGGDGG